MDTQHKGWLTHKELSHSLQAAMQKHERESPEPHGGRRKKSASPTALTGPGGRRLYRRPSQCIDEDNVARLRAMAVGAAGGRPRAGAGPPG